MSILDSAPRQPQRRPDSEPTADTRFVVLIPLSHPLTTLERSRDLSAYRLERGNGFEALHALLTDGNTEPTVVLRADAPDVRHLVPYLMEIVPRSFVALADTMIDDIWTAAVRETGIPARSGMALMEEAETVDRIAQATADRLADREFDVPDGEPAAQIPSDDWEMADGGLPGTDKRIKQGMAKTEDSDAGDEA